MGIIRRTIKQALTDRFGFYSQAEELALNLEQKELRGEQARAFFKKNGVKDMEINELGLDELFNQEKVTQQEILEAINENRIEFEVTEYNDRGGLGQAPSNRFFDRRFLSYEEANRIPVVVDENGKQLDLVYTTRAGKPGVFVDPEGKVVAQVDMDPDGIGNFAFRNLEDGLPVSEPMDSVDQPFTKKIGEIKLVFNQQLVDEVAEDPVRLGDNPAFLFESYSNPDYPYYDRDIDDYIKSEDSRILDYLESHARGKKSLEGRIYFEDLSPKDQRVIKKIVFDSQKAIYDDDPMEKLTLNIDGNETPYSMIGNEFYGYMLSPLSDPRLLQTVELHRIELPDERFPMQQRNDRMRSVAGIRFDEVTSGEEAQIRLATYARRGGDLEDPDADMDSPEFENRYPKWTKFTLPGGTNPREHVFKLKLPERMFSEDAHYDKEQNQVFHLRTKDRVGPDDENILYVEEFQSDWAQTGREHGYEDPEAIKYAEDAAAKELQPFLDRYKELLDTAITQTFDGKSKINVPPDAARPPAVKEFIKALSDAHATRDLSSDKTMKFSTRLRAMEGLRSANSVWNRDISTATRELMNRRYIQALTDSELGGLAIREMVDLFDQYGADSPAFPDSLIRELEVIDDLRRDALGALPTVEGPNMAYIDTQLDFDEKSKQAIADYVSRAGRLELEDYVDERGFMTMSGGSGDTKVNKALRKQVEDRLRDSLPQTDTFDNVLREQSRAEAMQMMEDSLAPYGLSNQDFIDAAVALARFDTDEKAKKGVEQSSPYSKFVKRAPFVTDTNAWTRLGMKYLFDFAAKEGYDGVAFTPGLVHSNRWKNPKLIPAYDNIIPQAVDKVFKPTVSSKKIEGQPTIDVADKDGTIHTSRIILMSDATKDGSTIGEKAAKRRPMLSLPIGAGILGLQAMSPEQAEAQVLETGAQDLQEQQFPMQPAAGVPSVFDPIIGGAQIVGEAISDSFIEPALRSAAAETAFEFGMTPEQAEAAGERGARVFDYEVTSPTAKRYKEAIKGGVGELAEYLMRQPAPTGRTRSGQVIPGTGRNLIQQIFQDAVIPASEAATEAGLGIIALDPRDTEEMEAIRQSQSLPLIESIQPI